MNESNEKTMENSADKMQIMNKCIHNHWHISFQLNDFYSIEILSSLKMHTALYVNPILFFVFFFFSLFCCSKNKYGKHNVRAQMRNERKKNKIK